MIYHVCAMALLTDAPQLVIQTKAETVGDTFRMKKGENVTMSCTALNSSLDITVSWATEIVLETTTMRTLYPHQDVPRTDLSFTAIENDTIICHVQSKYTTYKVEKRIDIIIVQENTDNESDVNTAGEVLHSSSSMIHFISDY